MPTASKANSNDQPRKKRETERERGYTQKHRLGARTAGPSGLHGEAAGQHPDATHLYPTDSYGATRRAAGPQPTTSVNETGQRAQREQDSSYRPGTPSTGNAARPATGRKSLNWASSKRVEGGSLSGASCGAGHGTRPPESSAGKAAGWSGNRRAIELCDCELWGAAGRRRFAAGCCFSVSLGGKSWSKRKMVFASRWIFLLQRKNSKKKKKKRKKKDPKLDEKGKAVS